MFHQNLGFVSFSCAADLTEQYRASYWQRWFTQANEGRLVPAHANYLDTLAEVCFLRGDAREAVELEKQCVQLDPGRGYYRKQLERFRKGSEKSRE